MNRYLAFIICALVGLLSFITYLNMLVPIENEIELGQNLTESEYKFEEKINGIIYTFTYTNKQKHQVVISKISNYKYHKDLRLPAQISHKDITYDVVGIENLVYIQCDELFIPESIVYIDERNQYARPLMIRYISVDPNNKHYRSVDGNLYKGNLLIYDTQKN